MSIIPFAPAPAPAPPAAPGAPVTATGGSDLGGVFAALVDTLSNQFLETDDATPAESGSETLPDDAAAAEATADATEPTIGAIVAALAAHPMPDVPVAPLAVAAPLGDGNENPTELVVPETATPADTGLLPETELVPATELLPETAPPAEFEALPETDVVPDTDVAPDSPFEAAVTDVTAVEDGRDAPATDDSDSDSSVEEGPAPTAESTTEAADVPIDAPLDGDADVALRPAAAPHAPESGAQGGPGTVTTAPTAAVDGASPATAANRPAPPAVPNQLVTVLTPLRSGPDGTHRVALQLRPDELGEVLIDVRVRGNEITLNVRTDLAGTAELVRASLAELRSELEAAGFRPGDLDVASHADSGADDPTNGRTDGLDDGNGRDRTDTERAADADASTLRPDDQPTESHVPTTGLDLRL